MIYRLTLCIVASLVAGCKVEITVPAGGSVVTSSGLYACAAGETCSITIDHPYFSERFTAVPARGYIFSRWEDAPGAFCAGSHKPVCDDIDTGIFLDNADLLEWLNFDASYSLTPVFSQLASPGDTQAPVWQLSSEHVAVNYLVDGVSADEILDSLRGDNNPLQFSASSEGLCDVIAGTIEVAYITTIPQLFEYQQKPSDIQDSWSNFQGELIQHEVGHQQINRFYYGLLPELYSAVGAAPCDDLADAIKRVHKQWELQIIAAHVQYHVDVGSSASFRDHF